MKTKVTDSRKTTRTVTVVTDDGGDPSKEVQEAHVDTRKVFIYFEEGDVTDWTNERTIWGSTHISKSRNVVDTWRPQWVAASWYKYSDQDTWVMDSTKMKSLIVKKDGGIGLRDKDTFIWSNEDRKKLSEEAAKFIEQHVPGIFPFTVADDEKEEPLNYSSLDRSFDDHVGMGQ